MIKYWNTSFPAEGCQDIVSFPTAPELFAHHVSGGQILQGASPGQASLLSPCDITEEFTILLRQYIKTH